MINAVPDIRKHLANRILVVDGAMGTSIQAYDLAPEDFGGVEYEGCNEYLNLTRPEIVKSIHRAFLTAGADIIETNTFGSTPLVLEEYGLGAQSEEISRAGALLAKEAASEASTLEKPRFVAGSMGPTTKAISVTGGVEWDDLKEDYRTQARGLISGGSDLLLVETSQDTLNVKAALIGISEAQAELSTILPVAVQCTIEPMGAMLGGQDIEAFYASIEHYDLLWIGMNCATGPQFMRDHVRTLSNISRFPVAVIPNAGLPDEDGNYNETPEHLAAVLEGYAKAGWINVLGGCCGTIPQHIDRLAEIPLLTPPRVSVDSNAFTVAGLEAFTMDDDSRPVIIGERTNVLGSRHFRGLIADGAIDAAAEIGRQQVRGGAHILDVCLQDPDRDEIADLTVVLTALRRKVKVPFMIDSTDPIAVEAALKLTPGKSIINSINLEDGESKFETIVPLIRKYGAAVIVGCIDDDPEQAQAITRERKLEVASKSYDLLTNKYGLAPQNIVFDPLVFPIGTGDRNYVGAGLETIEGVRLITKAFPLAKTVLGISNVSFGLPAAGREVLNSVMLYHCVQAGLDAAIVNSQRVERYASISNEEKQLAENLIWNRGDDPIGAFADHFRGQRPTVSEEDRRQLPLNDRISNAVIDGIKTNIIADLEEALRTRTALEIINGPLMAGMDEVGKLFGSNQLIVAEVLESAEVMKVSVTFLEEFMEPGSSSNKGTILLATVKGDVHDIGKNLVEIILANNGYRVVNLGIKITPVQLIEATTLHTPDLIGLSGLLVKSAQMMIETVQDLTQAGIEVPILVGGAALSNRFTRLRIAPEYKGIVAYCQDAMNGLDVANQLMNPELKSHYADRIREETLSIQKDVDLKQQNPIPLGAGTRPRAIIQKTLSVPIPPDLTLHVIDDYSLDEIFDYINPMMLYVRHLGFRGRFNDELAAGNRQAIDLYKSVERVQTIMVNDASIRAKAVYGFFRAGSTENTTEVIKPDGIGSMAQITFGRQSAGEGLCLADYLLPVTDNQTDYLGMFVTSIGPGVRKLADEWRDAGNYLDSHILQSIALEAAEGFAELLHKRMRAMWGFADPDNFTMSDLFRTQYQGRRYSFGYPACPRLEDQSTIWQLLNPTELIGVELTEGYMMDPEASVSALVFHHPEAKYFNLSEQDVLDLQNIIS
jgi:5-methyltetrahydrofolate--homocysteine methyltransferase